jgi:hypothetical protein
MVYTLDLAYGKQPNKTELILWKHFIIFTHSHTLSSMKNVVFWDVALCTSCVNRRFGGKYRLHLQGIKSASEEPVWPGGCRLSHQSKITSYIGSEQSETECRPHGNLCWSEAGSRVVSTSGSVSVRGGTNPGLLSEHCPSGYGARNGERVLAFVVL